ncbi:Pga17 GPI-anchored protein [Candida orthopsilosis Co 90-125]|uniref:Pga17 GPI-anchored protein n=1 Tax=Candida orthopsilosis (strain 90-125) TaxID=1136231 RepID=H8WXJ9_CANO9|nr:Pga17 GPI-anchored protein [Candida orthopsilosis Co 90-125]CCG21505.1 Pga17 GPI-anchored protein [Candida orthopsilosis Co 90-125]
MKFSTILASTLSLVSFVTAQPVAPVSGQLTVKLETREMGDSIIQAYQLEQRDLSDIVSGLLSNINFTAIIDDIDFDGIAEWINGLLTENNNIQYLENILNFLGRTNLVPILIGFVVSNNETRHLAYEAVVSVVNSGVDPEPLFVALKDSGLLYTIIADLVENENTLPLVFRVIEQTLSGIDFGALISQFLVGGSATVTLQTNSNGGSNTGGAAEPTLVVSNPLGGSGDSGSTAAANTQGSGGDNQASSYSSVDVNSINQLISQAAGENTNTATSVTRTTNQGQSQATSYDLATLTGPAFQSVPTSQIGQGQTSVNYASLTAVASALGGSAKKRDTFDEVLEIIAQKRAEEYDEAVLASELAKRNGVEDLLTTIFTAIAQSNLINETINYLLTDSQFEGSVVLIIRDVLASLTPATFDFDTSSPLIAAIQNSGLIPDLISRALNDDDLKAALLRDVRQVISQIGSYLGISKREVYERLYARDEEVTSSFISIVSQSTINSNASTVATIDAANAGSSASLNLVSVALAAIGLSAFVL